MLLRETKLENLQDQAAERVIRQLEKLVSVEQFTHYMLAKGSAPQARALTDRYGRGRKWTTSGLSLSHIAVVPKGSRSLHASDAKDTIRPAMLLFYKKNHEKNLCHMRSALAHTNRYRSNDLSDDWRPTVLQGLGREHVEHNEDW